MTEDGIGKVYSAKTVCRKGPGISVTPPKCPWTACLDDLCETCLPDWEDTSA